MNLFQFAGNGLNRAYFGADSAADAQFGIDLRFLAHTCHEILDGLGGADCGAETAIDAFIIVDARQIVLYGDGLNGAFARAAATADTGMSAAADSFGVGTLILRGAFDIYGAIDGNEHDEIAGAGFHASAATGAFGIIDHSHIVGI